MKKELKIYLASPRGFCAGVKRAIEIVEKAINKYGTPVYVRHEIVHNKQVVEELKEKGAIFECGNMGLGESVKSPNYNYGFRDVTEIVLVLTWLSLQWLY